MLVMREAVCADGSELFGRADVHDRCGAWPLVATFMWWGGGS